MLYLHPKILKKLPSAQRLFEQMMAIMGERFRQQKGRSTYRIGLGNEHYFIKQHTGVGWKEIFKNLLQGRMPVISAKNEWQALQKLKSLGIHVPDVLGFGERGANPAKRESFVLMSELRPAVSLETLCRDWQVSPPSFALKQLLIKEVARIARTLHENGINHRDFYICHFLLDQSNFKLYLIDLHRAQIRSQTPKRWVMKDLAALYFSSKEIGLTQRDLYRFIREYRRRSIRDIMDLDAIFWEKVKQRGEQLYLEHIKS